jgi:hypothetical protein
MIDADRTITSPPDYDPDAEGAFLNYSEGELVFEIGDEVVRVEGMISDAVADGPFITYQTTDGNRNIHTDRVIYYDRKTPDRKN